MSDTRQIYESDALCAYRRRGRSNVTVVLFGSAGLVGTNSELPRLGFLEAADLSAVIISPRRRHWFPRSQTEPCLREVRRVLGGSPVVTYGASMGGYGAIKYASALRARHVLAISPQFSLDRRVIKLKSDPFVGSFRPHLHEGMDIAPGDAQCPVDILYDPVHPNDREHASLIAAAIPSRLTHARNCGHALEVLFGGPMDLADLIAFACAGQVEQIRERIRRNKRTSIYFHMTLYRALCDRRPRTAERALRRAAEMPALGSDDRISRSEAQMKLGHAPAAARELGDAYGRATRESSRWMLATGLSAVFAALGRDADAVSWIKRAGTHAPEDEQAWSRVGAVLVHAGRMKEAEPLLRRLVEEFDLPPSRLDLARVLDRLGRREEAAEEALRALPMMPPENRGTAIVARILCNLGRRSEAEAMHRATIEADDASGDDWLQWSRFLVADGRAPEALAAARRAMSLRPSVISIRNHLANVLIDAGRLDEAWPLCRDTVDVWLGGGAGLVQRAVVEEKLGWSDRAADSYRDAISREPYAGAHRAAFAEFLLRVGDIAGAAEVVDDAFAAAEDCAPTAGLHMAEARILTRLGDRDAATAAYQAACDLAPSNAGPLGALAAHLLEGSDPEGALPVIRAAVELEPSVGWLQTLLLRVLEALERGDEALAVAADAVRVCPAYPPLHLKLITLLSEAGWVAEAGLALHDAFTSGIETAELRAEEASLAEKAGDLAAACRALRRAVDLAPANPGMRGRLANLLLQSDDAHGAAAEARVAVGLRPDALWLHHMLVNALAALGDDTGAAAACESAIAAHPANPFLRARLAGFLIDLSRHSDAEDVIARAIADGQISAELFAKRAKLCEAQRDWAGAADAASHAAELAPANAGLHGALALYLLQLGRLAEAAASAKRGLAIQPDAKWIRSALARATEQLDAAAPA